MSGKRATPAPQPSVGSALKAVIDYLWDEEKTDYFARTEGERAGHIFRELRALRRWCALNPEMLGRKASGEIQTPPPAYVAKECPRPGRQPKAIRSASDVHAFCEGLHALRFEEFHVLLLNGNHEVTRRVMVSRGTLNQAQVHPREVFRPAIRSSAAAVVLVHNHPSGNPEPSPEDIQVTRKLVEVGNLHGIKVLDHVVVSTGGYVSLSERGIF